MSIDTKNAVYEAIAGDTEAGGLVALLAKDPNAPTDPAAFLANKNQSPPVYPSITYRVATGVPDPRFRPPLQEPGPSTVEDEYWLFEVWSKSEDSAEVETIAARLAALFDGQRLALASGAVIFRGERTTAQPDLYDKDFDAYYGLYAYRLRIQYPSQ